MGLSDTFKNAAEAAAKFGSKVRVWTARWFPAASSFRRWSPANGEGRCERERHHRDARTWPRRPARLCDIALTSRLPRRSGRVNKAIVALGTMMKVAGAASQERRGRIGGAGASWEKAQELLVDMAARNATDVTKTRFAVGHTHAPNLPNRIAATLKTNSISAEVASASRGRPHDCGKRRPRERGRVFHRRHVGLSTACSASTFICRFAWYICPYCDFAKWPARASATGRYLDALYCELDREPHNAGGNVLPGRRDTQCVRRASIARLVTRAARTFAAPSGQQRRETTIECNPELVGADDFPRIGSRDHARLDRRAVVRAGRNLDPRPQAHAGDGARRGRIGRAARLTRFARSDLRRSRTDRRDVASKLLDAAIALDVDQFRRTD